MYNVVMNVNDSGIKIIQVRIVELTNQKIDIESQIREVKNKIDLETREYTLKELNRHRKMLIGRLIEVEKILHLNKFLLNQTDEHEYQLEN